jgi:hypothetical protein
VGQPRCLNRRFGDAWTFLIRLCTRNSLERSELPAGGTSGLGPLDASRGSRRGAGNGESYGFHIQKI